MLSSPHPRDAQYARIIALREEWVQLNTEISRLEARKAVILSERFDALLEEDPPGFACHDAGFRSMAAEFAASAHQSSGAVESAFCRADTLVHNLPATLHALSEGQISVRHADVIIAASRPLAHADAEERDDFERQVLATAVAETPSRTAVHAKAVAASIAPETVTAQHQGARLFRSVHLIPLDDGMSLLQAEIPEVLGRAIMDRLTGLAKHVMAASKNTPEANETLPVNDGGTPRDERSLNEVRADVLTDLLLTAHTETVSRTAEESITATVQVTIASSTLMGNDERLAELDGHGPVLPDLVRTLAGRAASWNRLFINPEGMAVMTDNYVPTAGMKRFLRARDQRCRFPGCRMPVHRCQIDHNHDHALGGPTDICNLCHFCQVHHVLKHPDTVERYRWNARQIDGGIIEWISPEGAIYIDKPPMRVMFAEL